MISKDFSVFPTSYAAIEQTIELGKAWADSIALTVGTGLGNYTIVPVTDPQMRSLIFRFEVPEKEWHSCPKCKKNKVKASFTVEYDHVECMACDFTMELADWNKLTDKISKG